MKLITGLPQKTILATLLVILGSMNVLVWGVKLYSSAPSLSRYSSGTAFSRDGTILSFTDKFEVNAKNFSFVVRYNWNDKSNTMQETGRASYSLLGKWDLAVEDSSSVGISLLADMDLEEDFLFGRNYMQSGSAVISVLPISGEFEGLCYYVLFVKKVYCGAKKLRSAPPF